MTVGIAALATGRRAIVIMADKQRTDSDVSGVKIDDVDAKGFSLRNGWLVMYAGDGTFAQLVVSVTNKRMEQALSQSADLPMSATSIMDWVRVAYRDVREAVIDHDVFGPHLLDIQKYRDRTYDDATIRRIDALREEWLVESTADLLVCGFDDRGDGQIIKVTAVSGQIAGSYATIGSGGPIAEAHLSWRRTVMTESLPQVIYEVFEAKAHAERNAFVGATTDAFIVYSNGDTGGVNLTDDTQRQLAEVVSRYDRAPIEALAFYARGPEENARLGLAAPEEWVSEFTETKIGSVITIVENGGPSFRIKGYRPETKKGSAD